ncbi:hypothetical protein [Pedobacter miscanthi]|uniref:Uncharacterized protein n=1 Tax=Pedobacter miscanthi TaxID=2259170 RepID=A0A366L1T9_9SPHI|nr:hypothetical protein [Pedobacter miscanthi]RBQ07837.1 hypothetical protein DRW42_09540 [Pedobacter miscanthi]
MNRHEEPLPFDDQQDADQEDQQSQQDIHSNGLDAQNIAPQESKSQPIDLLNQAYRAAESAYLPGERIGSDYRITKKKPE